ncbi:MAG TPA: alpha/beta hydrolase [Gammaproteobacteria bacterium]|nr:alpha/beta hydrolase [Gammaproteobacteria bacterium]
MTVKTHTLNLSLALTLCCSLLCGCNPLYILNGLTPTSGFNRLQDVQYGDLPRQKLDVYIPAAATEKMPVVIFFHGGGWSSGDKDLYMYIGEAISSLGFVAVLPDYRLYPEVRFPRFVEDGAAAVAWVQHNIAAHGGDPGNVILMGHSAGGHIAAMLALDEHFLRDAGANAPQGLIGLAGVYDFLPLLSDYFGDIFAPPESYPLSQPVNFIDGSEPPVLLLHGSKDRRVPVISSRKFETRIRERGGCAKTVVYPELDHATLTWSLSVPYRKPEVMEEIRNFVRERMQCVTKQD